MLNSSGTIGIFFSINNKKRLFYGLTFILLFILGYFT